MAIKPLVNERELLAKIAAGDEHAFTILFDGYYNTLGEYLYKLTESLVITQEIIQDAFIKIWLKRGELLKVKNFSSYIFIICRNQAYNELRKKAMERNVLQSFGKMMASQTEAAGDTYRELIDTAVDKLPTQAQKVYLMSRDERLKHEEIGFILGISAETVKKHIQYANKFITDEIRSNMNIVASIAIFTLILLF